MKKITKGVDEVIIYSHRPSNPSGQEFIGEVIIETSQEDFAIFSTYWDINGYNKGRKDSRFNLSKTEMEGTSLHFTEVMLDNLYIEEADWEEYSDMDSILESLDLESITNFIKDSDEDCEEVYLVATSLMEWELHFDKEPDSIYTGASFKENLEVQYWIPKGMVLKLPKELEPNMGDNTDWQNFKLKITIEDE